jgi:hypothetical protein
MLFPEAKDIAQIEFYIFIAAMFMLSWSLVLPFISYTKLQCCQAIRALRIYFYF